MNLFQAVILGIVQGITELLPISSSAHLILVPHLFGWQEHTLVFDTTLHLGTALALLVYFRKEIYVIVKEFLLDLAGKGLSFAKYSAEGLLGVKILAGSIPAGILGLVFGDILESTLRGIGSVTVFLFVGSLLMILAEKFGKPVIQKIEEVSMKKSFVIGLFQSLALMSGISRSGSTISGAMLLGVKRDQAAKFSFLLSIPIVLSAGIFQGISSAGDLWSISPVVMLAGFLTSFLSGILAIKFLMGFLAKHKLNVFIGYRLALVLILIFTLI